MRSTHFFWKYMSPTAKTSSMIITSGSTATATLKPRRRPMPEEYVRTGSSM